MNGAFIVHILIALVWLFLSGNTTFGNFLFALGFTFVLLAIFRRALHCQAYVRRVSAFGIFAGRLIVAIVASNLRIMRVALRKDAAQVEGFFVEYDIEELTEVEVLILSMCIGLSPGTMVADRSPDGKALILHVFAAGSKEEVRAKLDSTLTTGILSFTR